MMTRPVAPFLALIIIGCAAACGDRQEQPPAADGRAAPGTSIAVTDPWSVTSRGAGPVRAGMTLAEAASSAQLAATDAAGECT